MSHQPTNLLQGTLDLLILKALAAGELHGLGVSRRIEQITTGTFSVQPGSLFPALHRLEEVYFPIYQFVPSDVTYLVRYRGQTGPILGAARERIAALDRNLPIYRVNTLEAEASAALLRQRLLAVVSTAFGLLALALACVGPYGLMAFAVACRVKEIGVRMALGATQRQVLWTILRESLQMLAIGLLIGVPSALALMRLTRTFLFGLTPADPMTLTVAIAVLTAVAVVAAYKETYGIPASSQSARNAQRPR